VKTVGSGLHDLAVPASYARIMLRNVSAVTSGLVFVAVAVYAFADGHKMGAAVVGGVGALTLAMPLLRRHFCPNLGLRQHLWISIVFFLVVALGFVLIAVSIDSDVRPLLWLVAVSFFGMAIAGVAMDLVYARGRGRERAHTSADPGVP
jgi:hypothetical protein